MRSAAIVALALLAACTIAPPGSPPEETAGAATTYVTLSVPVEVMKPAGAGPFPAVVMLHDCSGLGPRSSGAPRRWAKELMPLYPGCRFQQPLLAETFRSPVPLLVLASELDDWTPAAHCMKLVETAKRNGSPVEIKVYPGAHHGFDNAGPVRFVAERNNANAPGGKGATTGGNREAWADSIREVQGFFARHLKAGG